MHNTIILKIKGKNINNFIYKMHHKKINIYKIEYIKYNEVRIEIAYNDYDQIIKMKTIYDVDIEKYNGVKKVKNSIIYHRYLLISLLVGIFLFTILTNLIFDVEVSYSGSKMQNLIFRELDSYGIKKYHFVKSFNEISKIKQEILNNNKDTLEWIEIERVGTKYIVKIEPRKTNQIIEDDKIYNIVASQDAVIKSIEAYSGEIIKNINGYVKKGEVIISSNITLNGEVKDIISAKGSVYGEVWYKTKVEYPLNYYEEKETGIKKEYYNIRILNKDFNFSDLKNKRIEDKIILKSDILPIYFSRQYQREIMIIDYKLTYEEAITKAYEEGRKKMEENLGEKEFIMDEKSLKIELKDSKIVVDMFYTVYKDITEYIEIEG